MAHEEQWNGVAFKLGEAGFFFAAMENDLPRRRESSETRTYAAFYGSSAGTVSGNSWQTAFYYHFDAFLQAARSIPDIIQWQFGMDSYARRDWVDRLSLEELDHREKFKEKFEPDVVRFRGLPLSKSRVMTMHRTGTAPVYVEVTSNSGIIFRGSPTQSLPLVDQRPGPIGNTPAEYVPAISSSPRLLEPRNSDFWLEGLDGSTLPLFPECQTYLQEADALIGKARSLDQQIHGSASLTAPPAP